MKLTYNILRGTLRCRSSFLARRPAINGVSSNAIDIPGISCKKLLDFYLEVSAGKAIFFSGMTVVLALSACRASENIIPRLRSEIALLITHTLPDYDLRTTDETQRYEVAIVDIVIQNPTRTIAQNERSTRKLRR